MLLNNEGIILHQALQILIEKVRLIRYSLSLGIQLRRLIVRHISRLWSHSERYWFITYYRIKLVQRSAIIGIGYCR